MSTLGKKEGLGTKEEFKFFVKLAMGEISINLVYKTGIVLILPAIIDGIDNKVGDKLPEPWQTYAEDLITEVYNALQDKVITDEEMNSILEKISAVLAAEIDIPLIEEADEVVAFEYLLKYLAQQLKVVLGNLRKAQPA